MNPIIEAIRELENEERVQKLILDACARRTEKHIGNYILLWFLVAAMQPVALLKVEMDEKLERRGGWLFDSFSMEGTQGTNDVSGKESIFVPL